MRRRTSDLDVGSVGLEYPGHRILTAPIVVTIIIVVVVVSVTHPLVIILTVSHVLPFYSSPEVNRVE
jgi:hypothetical protein